MKNSIDNYIDNFLECVQEEIILTSILESLNELDSDTLIEIKSGIDFILNERIDKSK